MKVKVLKDYINTKGNLHKAGTEEAAKASIGKHAKEWKIFLRTMNNYYVRARLRGTIDYRKAVVLDGYFGEHEAGVQFCDDASEKVYKPEQVHVAGSWE